MTETGNVSQTQPTESNAPESTQQKCLQVVEKYRLQSGRNLRLVHELDLFHILQPSDIDEDEEAESKARSLATYQAMLDEIDKSRETPPSSQVHRSGRGGDERGDARGQISPKNARQSAHRTKPYSRSSRPRSAEGRPSRCIPSSNRPPNSRTTTLSTSQQAANDFLHNLTAPISPTPCGSLSSPTDTSTFGEFEILAGPSKPSHRVTTHGDWSTSFATYRSAVLYAYPHRREELDRYERFIRSLFVAVNPLYAGRVVSFDRAARIRAGSRNDILLSEPGEFHDLHTMHISTAGAAVAGNVATPTKPKGGKHQSTLPICRKFNRGDCRGECRFCHVCTTCQSNEHGANSCGSGSGSRKH